MKLRILYSASATIALMALVGCMESTVSTNASTPTSTSVSALSLVDSTGNQNVTVLGSDSTVVFQGSTDSSGAFQFKANVDPKKFPLHIVIGPRNNPKAQGDVRRSDLDSNDHADIAFLKDGPHFGPGTVVPRFIADSICKLPKPDSTTMALVKSYVEQHIQVPDSILPVLTTAQINCIRAHAPINPGQNFAPPPHDSTGIGPILPPDSTQRPPMSGPANLSGQAPLSSLAPLSSSSRNFDSTKANLPPLSSSSTSFDTTKAN